jgi:hypothetical protein
VVGMFFVNVGVAKLGKFTRLEAAAKYLPRV